MSVNEQEQFWRWSIVEKRGRSGIQDVTRENTLAREALCLFGKEVASVVAEVGSLFPRVWGSICKSCVL